MELYPPKSPFISSFWRDKYEREAKRYWDKFYQRNSDRFFKDRHYLDKEWGQYLKTTTTMDSDSSGTTKVLLEAGCGAGNTVFPLLSEYPHLFVYACDFSPRAVRIVQDNAQQLCSAERVHAFVCDITSEELTKHIQPASVDIVTMVFMLSAVSPERMPGVLENIKAVLKPGGVVLFRDYAVGDLAEERLKSKDQQISDSFFVRGDGTRAFYFSEQYLSDLFVAQGLAVKSVNTVCKVVENRSRGLQMQRRWIQGVFGVLPEVQLQQADEIVTLDGTLIFNEEPVVEEAEVKIGHYRVRARCISRAHQHTCTNTGLMLWESALALCHLLLELPTLAADKNVLELGSGCLGLCSLFLSLFAKRVVATDCDDRALHLLRSNLQANSADFPVHRISARKLSWGNDSDMAELGSFDTVVGTDVTYIVEALPTLFRTARSLLRRPSGSSVKEEADEPCLLLAHMARKVGESEIVETARLHGFQLRWRYLTKEDDDQLPLLGRRKLPVFDSPVLFLSFVPEAGASQPR